jgi:hypothetical protein
MGIALWTIIELRGFKDDILGADDLVLCRQLDPEDVS